MQQGAFLTLAPVGPTNGHGHAERSGTAIRRTPAHSDSSVSSTVCPAVMVAAGASFNNLVRGFCEAESTRAFLDVLRPEGLEPCSGFCTSTRA